MRVIRFIGGNNVECITVFIMYHQYMKRSIANGVIYQIARIRFVVLIFFDNSTALNDATNITTEYPTLEHSLLCMRTPANSAFSESFPEFGLQLSRSPLHHVIHPVSMRARSYSTISRLITARWFIHGLVCALWHRPLSFPGYLSMSRRLNMRHGGRLQHHKRIPVAFASR